MKISVIVPALNEAQTIIESLNSIRSQQGEFEIIVVDGCSTDGTAEVARPYATVINSQEQGRAIQMNAGARHACGDVLFFLHADSHLPHRALSALRSGLLHPRIVGGTFTLEFDSRKFLLRVIAFFTRFKSRFFHYGDQGIFVRKAIFEQLGGFKQIPIMEDIEFLSRLRKKGEVALIKRPITTSARRFMCRGIIRQQLLDIILVVLYLLGANPERLSRLYRSTDCRNRS